MNGQRAPFLDESSVQHPDFKHPVTRWSSMSAFHAEPEHEDGIHVIGEGTARQVEIFTGGNPFESAGEPVLVIFSGAISARETKVPPFFSGSGLAASTGHAFIAISDPGIELSETLSIAWYAGSAYHDTRTELIELLGPLSRRLGTDLWLVGGSAGGFAALAMGHALPGGPSVFTWNPQTDILEYGRRFVTDYVSTAFEIDRRELSGADYKAVAKETLRRNGKVYSHLDPLPSQGPGRLFYLQNATDVHFLDHCSPYLKAHGYARFSPGVWRRDRNHVIWIADVAPGHTPPSRDQLITLLRHFTHTPDDVITSVRHLDAAGFFRDERLHRPEPLAREAVKIEQKVLVEREGVGVRVSSELPEGIGGLNWRAAVVDRGVNKELSDVRRSWGEWTPATTTSGSELVVTVRDGFGERVFSRTFRI